MCTAFIGSCYVHIISSYWHYKSGDIATDITNLMISFWLEVHQWVSKHMMHKIQLSFISTQCVICVIYVIIIVLDIFYLHKWLVKEFEHISALCVIVSNFSIYHYLLFSNKLTHHQSISDGLYTFDIANLW